VLGLDGVQYDESPGVTYEVYLNLPEGQEPDYRSDYVGNVGFFGWRHMTREKDTREATATPPTSAST
jgi:hypothetical protein